MAAAVRGLSPVIITVRMPIRRSSANRSRMPGFTTSLRWMTPSTRPFLATTSGVPPDMATPRTSGSAAAAPPCGKARAMASDAPLRIWVPSARSMPLIRVWAVKGTTLAPCRSAPSAKPCWRAASSTVDFPSGVSSARLLT